MDRELSATLLKVAFPIIGIVAVMVATKARGFSPREDLRLVWPKPSTTFLWIGIWIVWVALGEVATRLFDLAQARPWTGYSFLVVVLRIAAIGILGPAAEEILMRGLIFFRLSRTRLGSAGAIVLGAAGWALMHYQYDAKSMALIFLDGLVLGLARHRARSTYVPIVMHSLGNLFSIWQSLSG